MGIVYQKRSDYGRALEFFQKSLDIAEKTGDTDMISVCTLNIGIVYQKRGEYSEGARIFPEGPCYQGK